MKKLSGILLSPFPRGALYGCVEYRGHGEHKRDRGDGRDHNRDKNPGND